MNVFEYVKSLDIKEFDQFMYAIYRVGNIDRGELLCDDETGAMFKASNFDAEKFTKTLQDYTEVSVHDTFEALKQQKNGKWIDPAAEDCYRCSVCEEYTHMEMPGLLYLFCPNCGAKMATSHFRPKYERPCEGEQNDKQRMAILND